ELFVPELVRLLMLEGAEIIVSPVHGLHNTNAFNPDAVRDTWRSIARARAAENIMYVLVTQNLYRGQSVEYPEQMIAGAIAAGPEEMVGSSEKPGVLVADLDLDRLRYLRTRNYDEENLSRVADPDQKPLGCRPGQLFERYPELYRKLTEPSPFSFNYRYWEKGLDTWQEDYGRIYGGDYDRILTKSGAAFSFRKE
ncbi:MAG: nitrilase-related carbon-nitrogen hydrolase, partial [Nitrospinota bacterium]